MLASQSFVHTNAGTINVQNVKLEGNVRMETNAGTISFSGSFDPRRSHPNPTTGNPLALIRLANDTDVSTATQSGKTQGEGVSLHFIWV